MFIIRLAAEALSIADSQPVTEKQSSFLKESSPPAKATNFLYSILSGEEGTSVAQQRSQLGTYNAEQALADAYLQQQKQRSNSVIVHRSQVKCSSGSRRPSSVPQSTRYTPYPMPKKCGQDHLHQAVDQDQTQHSTSYFTHSPSRSVSTDSGLDEPLDLTKQVLTADFSDSDSISSSPSRCNDLPFTMPSIPHISSRLSQPTSDLHRPSSPPSEYVQLAKKMARPVQCRVSEWFRQMTDLVTQSGPDGSFRLAQLPASLRLRLLQASWHRVLVLYMAEHSLRFATSPLHETSFSAECKPGCKKAVKPTQNFVDQLSDLIDACSSLPFDHSTYDLIRIAVILMDNNSSLNSSNLGLLENYLTTKADASQLRSVMKKINDLDKFQLEALFCTHLNVPVDELLKSLFCRSSSVYSISTVN